ncbi:hypothetical protein HOO54_17190 [Bacillus sp. WMMC1349]|nr:hypothetical protein [Bacillus sp. WMMC1349]NPC93903.1 hypothetical protein [Bacillus sp. WMMC1349]
MQKVEKANEIAKNARKYISLNDERHVGKGADGTAKAIWEIAKLLI